MTKHTYIIVRHGFSSANRAKVIVSSPSNGVLPAYGLTEEGKKQSVVSGTHLREAILYGALSSPEHKNKNIYVVSSPFSRAVQTADIFLKELARDDDSTIAYKKDEDTKKQKEGEDEPSNPPASSSRTSAAGGTPLTSLRSRILNRGLKPDVAYQLCERCFGEYELTPDTNYVNVWEEDVKSEHANTKDVEPLASVWARVSNLLNRFEMCIEHPSIIILVSHGDTLQITQTAFSGKPLTSHRSLKHLNQAEWRVLPNVTGNGALFKRKPVFSKL